MKPKFWVVKPKDIIYVLAVAVAAITAIAVLFDFIAKTCFLTI